jgi:hypothetical protein
MISLLRALFGGMLLIFSMAGLLFLSMFVLRALPTAVLGVLSVAGLLAFCVVAGGLLPCTLAAFIEWAQHYTPSKNFYPAWWIIGTAILILCVFSHIVGTGLPAVLFLIGLVICAAVALRIVFSRGRPRSRF